jgi:hypothetical protein
VMEGNSDILAEKLKKEMDLMPLAKNYDITYNFNCCFFSENCIFYDKIHCHFSSNLDSASASIPGHAGLSGLSQLSSDLSRGLGHLH